MAFEDGAWEEALARCRPLLRVLAARSLNPRLLRKIDPSDMAQRAILEACEKRSQFRGSTEDELIAWLRCMLRHRLVDEVRRLRCLKNPELHEIAMEAALADTGVRLKTQLRGLTSPSRALVRHENALRLAAALERLPDDQRRAVELRHLEGLSLAATAELLKRSKEAVAGLLHRGLARLHEILARTTG